MQIRKILMAGMLGVLLLGTMQPVITSAEEKISTETVHKIGETTNKTQSGGASTIYGTPGLLQVDGDGNVVNNPADSIMGKVTTEEVNSKLVTKTNEVIQIVQNVGMPLTVLAFVFSFLFTVFGAFSKRGAVRTGIIAMVICVLCFTGIQYAREIVAYASQWLIS